MFYDILWKLQDSAGKVLNGADFNTWKANTKDTQGNGIS